MPTDADCSPERRLPRQRRRWLALALGGVGVIVVVLAAMAALALQRSASVERSTALEVNDVQRALLLLRVHDPRRALPGVVRQARFTQHEVELLIHHAADRLYPSRWQLELGTDRLQLRGSLPLAVGLWCNVELLARGTRSWPQVESLRVGALPLPPMLATWAIDRWAARHGLGDWQSDAVLSLQQLRFAAGRLEIDYAWGPDAPARLMSALLAPDERERLRSHAARLIDHTSAQPRPFWSLATLLPPQFAWARERTAQGHDAALENRAALLVLGMAANGVGLAALLPERRAQLLAHPIRLTLAGRRDFPQHLLVSAALAADRGVPLADRVGLFKELVDARSGSGFSFNDIAANRAGVRLGRLAVEAPEQLQRKLSSTLDERDFMPEVADLPEFLAEPDLRQRFGPPGAPAFEALMSDIERRLDATPLFR